MSLCTQTLYDRIVENATLYPNQTAFVFGNQSLSFDQYHQKVHQLSQGFYKAELQPGDRIAVLMDNNLEYPIILGACAKNGLIAVPLNTRTSSEEMLAFLTPITPKAIIFQNKYQAVVSHLCERITIEYCIVTDATEVKAASLSDWFSTESASIQAVSPDDGAVIIPTAAVDGVAKGALLSHRNLFTAVAIAHGEYGKERLQCYLGILPVFHILGMVDVWSTFVIGGKAVLMAQFDPQQVVDLIEQQQITYFGTFPPILGKILEAAKEKQSRLESLKMVHGLEFGPVIEQLQTDTFAEFWVGFGQTETASFMTTAPYNDCPGSAGRPSLYNALRIVNAHGESVANGEEGEIAIQGENVFLGYWKMDDATRYAHRYGWHHTGDIGKLNEEGYLFYVKPKPDKELIKTGGENVYPVEVESVLQEHPEIVDCVVIGVTDPQWGQSIKAICQLTSGSQLSSEAVIAFVGSKIAGYKKPRLVEFVDQLPQIHGGIDRDAVKQQFG